MPSLSTFNGRLRHECFERAPVHLDGRDIIEAWRFDYYQRRPHSMIGRLTPNEFVGQRQVIRAAEEASVLVKSRPETGSTSVAKFSS